MGFLTGSLANHRSVRRTEVRSSSLTHSLTSGGSLDRTDLHSTAVDMKSGVLPGGPLSQTSWQGGAGTVSMSGTC